MPAARFGLPLYAGALRRYVEAFGPAKAKDLILTGATIPADELQRYGIVSEIVEDDALETGAIALAIRMAELPAVPAQAMKQAINAFAGSVIDEQTWRRTLNLAFDGPAILTRIETALAMRRPPTRQAR
jgi:enoyl-CoA hydratase/carnithine racemase